MRVSLPLLLTLTAAAALAAPSAPVHEKPAFRPAPQELQLAEAGAVGFALGEGIRIDNQLSYNPMGRALIRSLQAAGVPVLPEEMEGDVTLRIANHINPEWYELDITPDHITIDVASGAAFPLLAQALAQAIVKDEKGQACLPTMSAKGEPMPAPSAS